MDPVTIAAAIWRFAKGLPREVWYAIAAVAAWWAFSSYYIGVGEDRILAQLEKEQIAAEKRAAAAEKTADENAQERAADEKETANALEKVIENAEKTGANPLDDLLGVWPSD